jgi:hypothetical protein
VFGEGELFSVINAPHMLPHCTFGEVLGKDNDGVSFDGVNGKVLDIGSISAHFPIS